jgi:hypothetical protein
LLSMGITGCIQLLLVLWILKLMKTRYGLCKGLGKPSDVQLGSSGYGRSERSFSKCRT